MDREKTVYRRAPVWQMAVGQLHNGASMAFYMLMTMMSYLAGEGYGIALAATGVILSGTRIFDGVIDPFLAVWIDKFRSRFGKIRILLLSGLFIRIVAALMLFIWGSNGAHGMVFLILTYMIYIVGNSLYDITGNMIAAVMTNDPKQRPVISVWSTAYSYMFPMVFTIISTFVILPKYNNQYTVDMMAEVCWINVAFALLLTLIACIGVTPIDKMENFQGVAAASEEDAISAKDMLRFLKSNRPFQMYAMAAVSEKLAQNVTSQAIVSAMVFGILIGNIQFGTMLTMISMLPSIIFALAGAKYAGKFGNKETMVTWTKISMAIAIISLIFCSVIDMRMISENIVFTILFFVLLLTGTGSKMCITTANNAMRADIVDYELDRSGKYLPAVVSATYNFIDQIVTSLGATIAAVSVSLIGYTTTAPQPTDDATPQLKALALFLYFGLPIMGWIAALIAMKYHHLTRDEMVRIQLSIADKKKSWQDKKPTG